MVNHDVQSGAVRARLAAGSLKTRDAVAISVSILAPGMAMFLNVPGVAAVAGGSTPLAFLAGGCGCLALAFVVVGFTRRMAGAGYAYTYISRGLGRGWGFLAGWLYAFGVLCFVPMTMAAVAYLACDLLGLPNGWWSPVFVVGMVTLLALAAVRFALTTRVQLLLGVLTVALILVVDVVVTVRGGAHGNTWAPFTFGHTVKGGFSGVFYGIILGITSYIGFETAADFGEETDNPPPSHPCGRAYLGGPGHGLLPVDHLRSLDRVRGGQRCDVRWGFVRAQDGGHPVRRPFARSPGRARGAVVGVRGVCGPCECRDPDDVCDGGSPPSPTVSRKRGWCSSTPTARPSRRCCALEGSASRSCTSSPAR
ncbi:MAG: hypothetical protein QOG57_5268, partial [Pseudonocardiales bacterium]|nr:hypothetical protein [Pseudonocardiales bacterium]